ncbi:hypothetical protein CROQUDRAFT_667889 [Cronartium quercuum f. sp. fusiforme G11]|uniref:Uncharacterized protein n=1 Tax=Cronartium quercuum f. sp. fusiforme G11 TaxID=708437 RepID=A0A9P6NY43_9BASI|nr:hypothetical protein CROQUDRAFT_667889 [Cronartium quercuum f. sp. fusiforme G11]
MSTTRFALSFRSSIRPLYHTQAELAPRARFSTSAYASDLVGKVQEAADSMSKKAGKAASKGIETLESATDKVKSATGTAGTQAKHVARDAQNEFGKTKDSAKSMAKDTHKKVMN